MATDIAVRRAWIGVLAAEMDGDRERALAVLRADPELAASVVMFAAELMITAVRGLGADTESELQTVVVKEMWQLALVDDGEAGR